MYQEALIWVAGISSLNVLEVQYRLKERRFLEARQYLMAQKEPPFSQGSSGVSWFIKKGGKWVRPSDLAFPSSKGLGVDRYRRLVVTIGGEKVELLMKPRSAHTGLKKSASF